MRMKTLAVVVTALCVAGGVTAVAAYQFGRSDLLRYDSQQTREAVLTRIPLGTEIVRAKAIMEAEGFRCTKLNNTRYGDTDGQGQMVSKGPADILWCDSGERLTAALVVSKMWQVSLVDTGGSVSDIAVGVGLTSP